MLEAIVDDFPVQTANQQEDRPGRRATKDGATLEIIPPPPKVGSRLD